MTALFRLATIETNNMDLGLVPEPNTTARLCGIKWTEKDNDIVNRNYLYDSIWQLKCHDRDDPKPKKNIIKNAKIVFTLKQVLQSDMGNVKCFYLLSSITVETIKTIVVDNAAQSRQPETKLSSSLYLTSNSVGREIREPDHQKPG